MNKVRVNSLNILDNIEYSEYQHLDKGDKIITPRNKILRISYINGFTGDDLILLKYLIEKHGFITSFKTIGDFSRNYIILVEFKHSNIVDEFIKVESGYLSIKYPKIHLGYFN